MGVSAKKNQFAATIETVSNRVKLNERKKLRRRFWQQNRAAKLNVEQKFSISFTRTWPRVRVAIHQLCIHQILQKLP